MNWVKCTDMRKQPIFVNIENATTILWWCLSLIVATMNQHGNSRGFGPALGRNRDIRVMPRRAMPFLP
jgi:hypothetical protein